MNSLGFDKPAKNTRIVVAMSGGVDSSTAAALMVEEGYDTIGITLQLYDQGLALQKKGACCAGQDIYDAQVVAGHLGIPHYVLDYESKFQQSVMEDFADSYMRGETPIPCVKCNQTVKFRDLLATARELGADALVTGHYVKRVIGVDGKAELHCGDDETRDQSYFLFATTQEQLDYLRFPLGGIPKTKTRALAAKMGLEIAEKPDSQDICFVPNGSYVSVVARLRPGALEKGNIRHIDGRILGEHEGIINYTIGQRRGLKIGGGDPLYVVRLKPETHEVIVGPKEALAVQSVYVNGVNWLGGNKPNQDINIKVKLRSTQTPTIEARLHFTDDTHADIFLKTPEYGVSPGQACVFYDGARVLGGGWIARTKGLYTQSTPKPKILSATFHLNETTENLK